MTAPAPLVALVGNPNAGKSALFNALTGARQKIGNYPGVTVERKAGRMALPDGRPVELVDLPGAYGLEPGSADEGVTTAVLTGRQEGQRRPDAIIVVLDAANLDNHLRFALELATLGLPMVIALNMIDLAERDGLTIAPDVLARALGVPVVATVAVRRRGLEALGEALAGALAAKAVPAVSADRAALSREARRLARAMVIAERPTRQWTRAIDRVLLHPLFGLVIFVALLFVMFQAVFSWSRLPMDLIQAGFDHAGGVVSATLPPGILRSFIVDGLIAGVGAVLAFLPQILVLFLFILVLEASGYMTRAAFVSDRLMAAAGLSGHSFIPLLSSFACAIPGIMATRTILDQRDRLTTILIAPLMTCSARLPVYTVIIGAFIPARSVAPGIGLQGLVLFALYLFGIVGAMAVSFVLRRTLVKGRGAGFLIEMPRYQWPRPRDIALGLWQRAIIFVKRAGGIILVATVILWALVSFPRADAAHAGQQVEQSAAGHIAGAIEPVFRPIGFNRDIVLALIPAMAAREVAVSALGTVYAVDAKGGDSGGEGMLGGRLAHDWPLATALAFLMWFVFAPQCISTIAVTRRETGGWRWPAVMVGYQFALAYMASGLTYWIASMAGL